MKLKEGMYVRTKDKKGRQFIRKIVDLPKDTRYGSIVVDKDIHNVEWVSTKNVLNASYNLIDLIEVGDYVNGDKVTEEMIKMRDKQGVFGLPDKHRVFIDEIKVKNIVTKEMFNSVKYEVE